MSVVSVAASSCNLLGRDFALLMEGVLALVLTVGFCVALLVLSQLLRRR